MTFTKITYSIIFLPPNLKYQIYNPTTKPIITKKESIETNKNKVSPSILLPQSFFNSKEIT